MDFKLREEEEIIEEHERVAPDEPSTSCPSNKRKLLKSDEVDISSSKETSHDDIINWTSLPAEILFTIFSHLSDEDLRNARLVCKSWNSISHIPELWQERRIMFGIGNHPENITNNEAALFMAKNSGIHLRDLKVNVIITNLHGSLTPTDYVKLLTTTVKEFFSVLPPGNNLKVFSLWGLACLSKGFLTLFPGVSSIRQKRHQLFAVLCSFIQKQYGLQHVYLRFSLLKMEPGLELLNALTQTQSHRNQQRANLLTLELDSFFSGMANVRESQNFQHFLSQMRYLKKLVINVIYLSDTSLQVFADNLKDLLTLELLCYDKQLASLTSAGWKYLADQLPELQTTVRLRGIVSKSTVGAILIPGMPLTRAELYYVTDYNLEIDGPPQNTQRNFEGVFIEVICLLSRWFKNSLKSFEMIGGKNRAEQFTELEEELFRMSQTILKLERISLPVHLSENFQKKMKEKRPDIELLYMGHGYMVE